MLRWGLPLCFGSIWFVLSTPVWPLVCVLVSPTQSGQTCCLVRLVLRFYIERVFGNYPSPQPEDRRCCSALANSFVTIRRSIHKCVSASWRLAARLGYECHWAGNNDLVPPSCAELQLLRGNSENRRHSAHRVQQGRCCVVGWDSVQWRMLLKSVVVPTNGRGRYRAPCQPSLSLLFRMTCCPLTWWPRNVKCFDSY